MLRLMGLCGLRVVPLGVVALVSFDSGVLAVEELDELLVRPPCFCPCRPCACVCQRARAHTARTDRSEGGDVKEEGYMKEMRQTV